MLANYLIGLREGIEAALIISILVTYLVKLGEKRHLSKIFIGTGAAIILSIGVGIALSELEAVAPANIEPAISGITSLIAVGFVTWMIFWMAKQARAMSGNLRGQINEAIAKSGWSLALVAFLAVIREGVETSVLLWTTAKTTGPGSSPVLGATLGLFSAAVIGYLMYRGSLKFNISKFFRFTGAFLVLVGAGILGYGIGELQEINWLPFLTNHSYDLSGVIPTDGVVDTVLRGTLAFNNAPTVLQTIFWFGYLIPTAWLLFRNQKTANK
jgi:high-affinity iron transporter